MSTTINPSRNNRLSEPKHPTCLDVKDESTCNATTGVFNIITGVGIGDYVYKQSFVIRSEAGENKHAILCLITNGDTTEIRETKPTKYLPFSFNFSDVLFGKLHIKKGDKVGIIVFNDRPNDFKMEYLEALRKKTNYDAIFDFDLHEPDVNSNILDDVINMVNKSKNAPKEGQGGVIISGG